MLLTAWVVAPESTTKRVLDHAASRGSWPRLLLQAGSGERCLTVDSRKPFPVLPCGTAHAT